MSNGCTTFLKSTCAALSFCLLLVSPVSALDKTTSLWLQQTLEDHGFDVGTPDGIIGQETLRSIAQFSESYDAPADPEKLKNWLIRMSARHIEEIKDLGHLEKIRMAVAEKMKDPSSAITRNVRWQIGPNGRFICGEVNGKNSYGAYAGFTHFHSLGEGYGKDYMENWIMPLFWVDSEPYGISFSKCIFSIPKK